MRCPVCRAAVSQGPQCPRCRADLSLLLAVEERARNLLGRAADALQAGRPQEALTLLDEADHVHASSEGRRLRALAFLLDRDFAGAWRAYAAARAG